MVLALGLALLAALGALYFWKQHYAVRSAGDESHDGAFLI